MKHYEWVTHESEALQQQSIDVVDKNFYFRSSLSHPKDESVFREFCFNQGIVVFRQPATPEDKESQCSCALPLKDAAIYAREMLDFCERLLAEEPSA